METDSCALRVFAAVGVRPSRGSDWVKWLAIVQTAREVMIVTHAARKDCNGTRVQDVLGMQWQSASRT